MVSVQIVDIAELCPPDDRQSVLNGWCGFIQYLPREIAAPGRGICVLDNQPDAQWQWKTPSPAKWLRPLGCSFLRDIEICGSDYFVSNGRFIREYTHTSDIALSWLERDDYPDNPFTRPSLRDVPIVQPVLLVFGPGFPIYGHWLIDFLPRFWP